MPPAGSVTRWLGLLRAGDRDAARHLWERYFRRLVGLARVRLQGAPRRAADEEDVALSAFASFCRNAEEGRFPDLADREELWRLLVVVTARKAACVARDEARLKRGGGRQPLDAAPGDEDSVLDQLLSREPDPAFAAQVADEYRRLMGVLADPELESVARWRLEGCTVAEIAGRIGYQERSVKRKLDLIREAWRGEVGL
jgi:DNA-directed RNA polymerase specialized sigma24 family protein